MNVLYKTLPLFLSLLVSRYAQSMQLFFDQAYHPRAFRNCLARITVLREAIRMFHGHVEKILEIVVCPSPFSGIKYQIVISTVSNVGKVKLACILECHKCSPHTLIHNGLIEFKNIGPVQAAASVSLSQVHNEYGLFLHHHFLRFFVVSNISCAVILSSKLLEIQHSSIRETTTKRGIY